MIDKQADFAYVNNARIHSWTQSVLSNEGKVSCSRKQKEPLMEPGTHDLQVSMDYESDALPTVPRRPLQCQILLNLDIRFGTKTPLFLIVLALG